MSPSSARVLLVEDNPDDVLLIKRVLTSCGLKGAVRVVSDGREAIDVLAANANAQPPTIPDLVILDLNLPKVSGVEVLQWVRADHRLRDLPIVILTGSREESSLVELHRLGVLGYLVKPLTARDFIRTVAGSVVLQPS